MPPWGPQLALVMKKTGCPPAYYFHSCSRPKVSPSIDPVLCPELHSNFPAAFLAPQSDTCPLSDLAEVSLVPVLAVGDGIAHELEHHRANYLSRRHGLAAANSVVPQPVAAEQVGYPIDCPVY